MAFACCEHCEHDEDEYPLLPRPHSYVCEHGCNDDDA